MGLNGKLHGQLVEHLLGVAVDDQADGLLLVDAALEAVKDLIFPNLAGRRFVLDLRRGVFRFNVRERVVRIPSTALTATWRSGYAEVCKTLYTGSIPVVASKL